MGDIQDEASAEAAIADLPVIIIGSGTVPPTSCALYNVDMLIR